MGDDKFTPGPWEAHIMQNGAHHVNGADDSSVCDLYHMKTQIHDGSVVFRKPNAEANARLIAAAPETADERDRLKVINAELLAALEGMTKLADFYWEGRRKDALTLSVPGQFRIAKEAISKAKGESE